eukprot:scaffold649143_cov43-Prasinocladus_malaysianus.AAC.1
MAIAASRFPTTEDLSLDMTLRLVDSDLANHAGALVGLAVVAVGAGGVELDAVGLAGGVQQVLAGDSVN